MIKTNKYILAGLLGLSALHAEQVSAMSKPAAATSTNERTKILERYRSLDRIKPISGKSILKIPKFVFENCNQGTKHEWSDDHLSKLRTGTGNLTVESTRAKFITDGKLDKQKFNTSAEGYDWVHALNLIEAEYLSKPYNSWTLKDIKSINKAAARLRDPNPGEFRAKDIKWNMHDFSVEEFLFFEYINRGLYNGRYSLKYNLETGIVNPSSIKTFLNVFKDNRSALQKLAEEHEDSDEANKLKNAQINPAVVDLWLAEQSSTEEGGLSYQAWLTPRIHKFPAPLLIEGSIERALRVINGDMASYSPVAKAAFLWYEIVRIHPWHEANKRTGKLLASAILLQSGYLPPLITKEVSQKFVDLLKYGFRKPDGAITFVEFIAEQIEKTQNNPEILKQVGIVKP